MRGLLPLPPGVPPPPLLQRPRQASAAAGQGRHSAGAAPSQRLVHGMLQLACLAQARLGRLGQLPALPPRRALAPLGPPAAAAAAVPPRRAAPRPPAPHTAGSRRSRHGGPSSAAAGSGSCTGRWEAGGHTRLTAACKRARTRSLASAHRRRQRICRGGQASVASQVSNTAARAARVGSETAAARHHSHARRLTWGSGLPTWPTHPASAQLSPCWHRGPAAVQPAARPQAALPRLRARPDAASRRGARRWCRCCRLQAALLPGRHTGGCVAAAEQEGAPPPRPPPHRCSCRCGQPHWPAAAPVPLLLVAHPLVRLAQVLGLAPPALRTPRWWSPGRS